MDGNEDGVVDFVEYLLHMNTLVQGTIDERLSLAFELYVKLLIQSNSRIHSILDMTNPKTDKSMKKN